MNVADWLWELGIEGYEPGFRASEIDATLLPSLTAEDLKDLGVTLVGHHPAPARCHVALGAEPSATTVKATSANIHNMLFVSVAPYCCSSPRLYAPSTL
jgi:hypothetical protein